MPLYIALAALARFFEVSADYLLELDDVPVKTGVDLPQYKVEQGLSYNGNPLEAEEADLVAMYRLLPSHVREDMFDQLYCLYRKCAERKKESVYWTYAADKEEQKITAALDGGD